MRAAQSRLRRFVRDSRGVSAIEFAAIAPFMILLLLGGYAVAQGVAVSRKVTITTRALADLVSQYASMSSTDMSTVEGAATQIMAPYSVAPLTMRITQIMVTSVLGVTVSQVSWSTAVGTSPYQKGITIQLPTNMPNAIGMTYILVQTTYQYLPPFGIAAFSSINMGDRIYMLPRVSSSVTYTGS